MKPYKITTGISVFLVMIGVFIIHHNHKIKEETSKREIVEVIENTSFIEKNKDGKYKIIKEKISEDSLSLKNEESLPRKSRVLSELVSDVRKGFDNLDALGQYNLDNQIYITGYYYLYVNDKNEADKYIDIVEKNINEKQNDHQKKDDEVQYEIEMKQAILAPFYFALSALAVCLLVMVVQITKEIG